MNKSIEQFERWVISSGYGEDIKREPYQYDLLEYAWAIWQASREAMTQEEVTTEPFLKVD